MQAAQQSATDVAVNAQNQAVQPKVPQQTVQMSKQELELYVRGGRPTGLLLRSVAQLKRLSVEAVAQASGIPTALVQSIFADLGGASIKAGAIRRVAAVLGIDLATMRFASGQVHVFDLSQAAGPLSSKEGRRTLRAIGLLSRNATVAQLKVGSGLTALRWRNRVHVAQRDSFRALFIGARSKRFDLGIIPSGQWVRKKQELSVVPIENVELIGNLIRCDLTEGEFDEMFLGPKALTWDDVRAASRINGVSKAELMAFIAARAREADETETEAVKNAVLADRPALRLIEKGPQVG